MSKDAPKAVLTSTMWDWSVYYTQAVQSIIDGAWTGENYFGGMKEGLVTIAPYLICVQKAQLRRLRKQKKRWLPANGTYLTA